MISFDKWHLEAGVEQHPVPLPQYSHPRQRRHPLSEAGPPVPAPRPRDARHGVLQVAHCRLQLGANLGRVGAPV